MNKIKLLYDVVKTMRNKENITGVLNVEVQKDQAKVFSLQNDFEKNMLTKQTKAKISTELDLEGKKVKHESNTEFSMQGCCGHGHHGFMKHMHHHHAHKCGGVKGKLSKLAFVLGLLNSLQTEVQENNTTVISLNINELPEDMKALIREKMIHAKECHHQGQHDFMKEFCTMENPDFVLKVIVNGNYEIEKIGIVIVGNLEDEQNIQHELKARAELNFSW